MEVLKPASSKQSFLVGFSALLTLASAFQCFSLILLVMKVYKQHSIAGVSQRTLILLVLCLSCRLISTAFYSGYLPVDRSGDWLYQTADLMTNLLAIGLLLYSNRNCHASLYAQRNKDTCIIWQPVVALAVLALIIHPSLNQNFIADFFWTFALYVETFSMVPQLFMMGKLGGEVEALTSHYLASMSASKVFTVIFWVHSYTELKPKSNGFNFAGWAVLISYTVQMLLYLDFL